MEADILPVHEDTTQNRPPERPQFGIPAMLWTTFVVALALGYLRQYDSPAMVASAGLVLAAAIFAGVLIGWPLGKIGDATYWSVVVAAAAYLSVAGETAAPAIFRNAWSLVGIMAGAACGAIAPKQLGRRMMAGAIAGGTAMLVCSVAMPVHDLEWMFDLICAPVIGACVAVLIELILWLERQSYSPRYVTASWLLCAVIVGNLLVPVVVR